MHAVTEVLAFDSDAEFVGHEEQADEPIDDLYVPTGHSSQRSDEQYAVVNTPEIPSVLASSPIIILPAGASYVVGEPQ